MSRIGSRDVVKGHELSRGSADAEPLFVAEEHVVCLRLHEQGVPQRGGWEREVTRYRDMPRDSYFYRDRVLPSGPYDADATGRLMLELGGELSFSGHQSRWGDRESWTL